MNEESLFHEALARANRSERAAFLDDACKGKPELRAAVEGLLAAHEASGPFLDAPDSGGPATEVTGIHTPGADPAPASDTVEFHSDARPNVLIAGRYTLQEKIGEGGMGEVWVAKQSEPVKRKVALKLIKQGMDSRAVLQRFEQERQALAMMDHPNIAKVLDAGLTPNGQPFFAMELVNGLPLNKFCDEARLATRERLELFVTICQAVQHAHQKGIVHRDLKPANILITIIDGKPVPKVIDFGVAKATAGKLTDESLSTQFGAIVGTLEYMSPEQAGFSGEDIDTRADIYSLGVILYELLTGLRPIDAKRLKKAALTEMIRIIREEEPSKPSTRLSTDEALPSMAALRQVEPRRLMALLRGELDWVVMKCLEKHRDRRYETANGLARDIQRYLADEAVEARPPSASYRMGKFLKRNKGPVLAASFVLLALVAGFLGTAWGLVRADQARRAEVKQRIIAESEKKKAEESEKLARQQRARAEEREGQAIDAVKRFRDAVAGEPELKNNPALESLRKRLLKEPLSFFKALRDRLEADKDTRPESLRRLAMVSYDLGKLTNTIGDQQNALAAFRESLAIRRKLADANPSVAQDQSDLADAYTYIGNILRDMGRHDEAVKSHELALAIYRRLAEEYPSVARYRAEMAANVHDIAAALVEIGKTSEAMKHYEAALAIWRKLAEEYPSVVVYRSCIATCQQNLGLMWIDAGRTPEAKKAYQSALETWQRLARDDPSAPQYQVGLANSHNHLGNLEAALEIRRKLADAHPSVPQYQNDLAASYNNIALKKVESGQPREAMKAYESSAAILRKLAEANPSIPHYQNDLVRIYGNIGNLLSDTGQVPEGIKTYESALVIGRKLVDEHPTILLYRRDLGSSYYNIGNRLVGSGRIAEGMKAYESALAILRELVRDYPEVPDYENLLGMALNSMAIVDIREKRFEKAGVLIRESIAWQRKALAGDPAHPRFRRAMNECLENQIRVARGLGDVQALAEAKREFRLFVESDPATTALDERLASLLHGSQQPGDAAERLKLAQRAYDKGLFASAAKFWGDALASEPKLADDRQAQHRYNAACAAALAGCGKGKDDPSPDDAARAKLRQQALDWLKAELAVWSKLVESSPPQTKPFIVQTLKHWQDDADLSGIRDEKELAKLPEDEQAALKQLWKDVDALRTKVGDHK